MNSRFTKITRIILGIILLLSGLNKIFKVIPTPADDLIESFGKVDYIFPVVAFFETLIGALLLIKKWVAFALLLLIPLSVNILLFHLYMDFQGIIPAIVVATLNTILVYKHWRQYVPLFN
ncbi:DoxX family membrane protein [Flavobacterium sp.]|uniref:DoxX family membrane protein n=1 Tax=Flavobacterium sp. TaxID=239 RepID=UPI00261D9ACD|nr:DoxX family membrane protein [Flavobacterium sp.]MDD3005412.1 DoxX family membrane protein [Flavobacterium sp.]